MNLCLSVIGGVFKALQASLIAWGSIGLFLIALLDAALIPLPGGPDVVVIALSRHSAALMPFYVAVAVAGSTIGSLILYWIAKRGGEAALKRFSPEKRERATRFVDKYDMWALLVAAVMPPPFPFKIFVLSAGAFRMHLSRFIAALVIGRGFRFVIEGYAAIRYGDAAIEVLKKNYPIVGLSVAGVIIFIAVVNAILRKRRTPPTQAATQESFR